MEPRSACDLRDAPHFSLVSLNPEYAAMWKLGRLWMLACTLLPSPLFVEPILRLVEH